jgi:hypothetical protein
VAGGRYWGRTGTGEGGKKGVSEEESGGRGRKIKGGWLVLGRFEGVLGMRCLTLARPGL